MKRTNLVLDEKLLEEATKLVGSKTYSATVNTALEELIRLRKMQAITRYFGSGLWDGNLSEMRRDRTRRLRRSK